MAFSFTKDTEFVAGDKRVTAGTFTNTGVTTGGNIYTGLQRIEGVFLQQQAAAVVADQPSVNETITAAGLISEPVTIVTTAGADGWWFAFGA
jgi:hypothetical protein